MNHPVAHILPASTQSLLIQPQVSGTLLSTATGFVIEGMHGPLLITNRHVVTGRHQRTGKPLSETGGIPNELAIWHNSTDGIPNWIAHVESLVDAEGNPMWVEHPTLGSAVDVVALRLTELQRVALYPYEYILDDGIAPSLGPADTISVIGFPFGHSAGGLFPIWATGFVASEPSIDIDNLPLLLIDCRSRQGQSGSPVVMQRPPGFVHMTDGSVRAFELPITRLIGVYSGRIHSESDIGLVWKVSVLHDLVQACRG